MKDMINPSETECPFAFNFDPASFKPGDIVSYRVPESFEEMPFVGTLVEVHDDYVMLVHGEVDYKTTKELPMRGTRESRPAVSSEDALR